MIIQENISLKPYNTFRTGGYADYFAQISNLSDLEKAVDFSTQNNLPFYILGSGSNTLFADEGFNGLIIKMEIKGIEFNKNNVIANAGENWDDLVQQTVEKNLSGLENLSFIPGTVGASVVQNIGAYGSEIKDVVEWVEVFDIQTGKIKRLTNDDCQFGYRDSIFKKTEGKKYIVIKVSYKLNNKKELKTNYGIIKTILSEEKIITPTIKNLRDIIIKIRKEKLPDIRKVGTAGSFFKNPIISQKEFLNIQKLFPNIPSYKQDNNEVKIPLAWLLDKLGYKGLKQGGIGVWDKQPLILVNYGKGTTEEVNQLAKRIKEEIKKNTGIEIEEEIIKI
jgi:UDP-N-acetylmuramate dehydrogenase